MGIPLKVLSDKDIDFYRQWQETYYTTGCYKNIKNRYTIGNVVRISSNLDHDKGCQNQIGIVESLSGCQNYCYVFSYDDKACRYWACGFYETDLEYLGNDYRANESLYKAFESWLISNSFNICTKEFEDDYIKHFNYIKPDTRTDQVISSFLTVAGESFKCECGSKLFHKVKDIIGLWECNCCGIQYGDENYKDQTEKRKLNLEELFTLLQVLSDNKDIEMGQYSAGAGYVGVVSDEYNNKRWYRSPKGLYDAMRLAVIDYLNRS